MDAVAAASPLWLAARVQGRHHRGEEDYGCVPANAAMSVALKTRVWESTCFPADGRMTEIPDQEPLHPVEACAWCALALARHRLATRSSSTLPLVELAHTRHRTG